MMRVSPVWIQQIVIGLAQEWEMKPLEVLRKQASFLAALPFNTHWARELFPQQLIDAKIDEAARLPRCNIAAIGPVHPRCSEHLGLAFSPDSAGYLTVS